MNVEIVERPEIMAAVIRIPRNGQLVREAWAQAATWLQDNQAVADREHGYVFIPEWQWATEVTTLWVGVPVNHTEGLPAGLVTIKLPARRYAKLTVQGDRAHMEEAYSHLFDWFEQGPFVRDTQEGSYGFETNRLHPVNPFDIPADEINAFDYDIYAPIMD